MTIEGFMAFENEKPVQMELSDDINGSYVNPFFDDAQEAEETALSYQILHGSQTTIEIRAVTMTIGDVVQTVKYDKNETTE